MATFLQDKLKLSEKTSKAVVVAVGVGAVGAGAMFLYNTFLSPHLGSSSAAATRDQTSLPNRLPADKADDAAAVLAKAAAEVPFYKSLAADGVTDVTPALTKLYKAVVNSTLPVSFGAAVLSHENNAVGVWLPPDVTLPEDRLAFHGFTSASARLCGSGRRMEGLLATVSSRAARLTSSYPKTWQLINVGASSDEGYRRVVAPVVALAKTQGAACFHAAIHPAVITLLTSSFEFEAVEEFEYFGARVVLLVRPPTSA